MGHLGAEATKKFNRLQQEIKTLCTEMTLPVEGTPYKTYTDRLNKKINPALDELLKKRDKYIIRLRQ